VTAAVPRGRAQRRHDAERRLAGECDLWVATASADGVPYLVPLSHHWDGETLLLATPASSPTGRNLEQSGRVRLAVGQTRDVCLIEGTVQTLPMAAIDEARGDAFAAHTGFDPRTLTTRYHWYRVTPRRVQAWREEEELEGRDLMRDGHWLDDMGDE
jgi:hypothetical protein